MAGSLIAAKLEPFLERANRKPFAWGRHDCMLWLADWLVELGREDPAKELRGLYSSALGAERVLRKKGGMATLISEALGAPSAREGRPGDVGLIEVVDVDQRSTLAGGICTAIGWAVLGVRGVKISRRAVAVAVWSV